MTFSELDTIIKTYRPRRKHVVAVGLVCAFLLFAPDQWLLFLLRSPHPYLPPWIGLVFVAVFIFQAVDALLHLRARLRSWWAAVQSRLPETNIFKRNPK